MKIKEMKEVDKKDLPGGLGLNPRTSRERIFHLLHEESPPGICIPLYTYACVRKCATEHSTTEEEEEGKGEGEANGG